MSAAKVVSSELCYCGKPLKHFGGHLGPRKPKLQADGAPKVKVAKRKELLPLLEAEVQMQHAEIARLKREIRDRQNALLDAEVKLKPLAAVVEAYQNKQLTGPAQQTQQPIPARTELAVVPTTRPAPTRSTSEETEEDFEPIEVDYNAVARWAAQRNLRFKDWNDLPSINMRREQFELPPFKKKLG